MEQEAGKHGSGWRRPWAFRRCKPRPERPIRFRARSCHVRTLRDLAQKNERFMLAAGGVLHGPVHRRNLQTDGAGQVSGSQGPLLRVWAVFGAKEQSSHVSTSLNVRSTPRCIGKCCARRVGAPDMRRSSSSDSVSVSRTVEDEVTERSLQSLKCASTCGSLVRHERGIGTGNREVDHGGGVSAPAVTPAACRVAAGSW